MASDSLDVVPAAVYLPGEPPIKKARVVVRDGVARVFVESGKAVVLHRQAAVTLQDLRGPTRSNPTTIHTLGGETWEVRRGSGCGCGSPLKRFNPLTWSA